MNNGVLYWNSGHKLLVRLTVSIASLREAGYAGPIALAYAHTPGEYLSHLAGVQLIPVDEPAGHDAALVAKTKLNQRTPYDTTVFLDSDTLVLKPFPELFAWGQEHGFVVTHFAGMGLDRGSIASRVRAWRDMPGLVTADEYTAAVAMGKGINIGVMAFRKDATIWNEWTALAAMGSARKAFIPDEVSCQYLIARHRHFMAPGIFNASCNRDKITDDTKIIHFHGRKHTSIPKTANTGAAQRWIDTFRRCYAEDRLGLREVVNRWPYKDEASWIHS